MELKALDKLAIRRRCSMLFDATRIDILAADSITMGNVQVTVRADGVKRILEFDPEFDDAFVWPLEAGLLHLEHSERAIDSQHRIVKLKDSIEALLSKAIVEITHLEREIDDPHYLPGFERV